MKKLIHTDNYESFYLDYLEGTLSESERAAFEEFLAAHPELQVDEDLLILDDAPELMDALEKELLKKEERSISKENLDYFAIGKMEQVLSPREEELLATYLLAHPEAQQVIEAYQKTRLEAQTVVYANKEELKEKEIALISWRFIAGIASAAAVLLLFFQLGFGSSEEQQTPVAQKDHKQTNKPEVQPKSNKQNEEYVIPSTNPVEENNTFVAQKTNQDPAPGSGNNSNQDEQNSEEKTIKFQQEPDKNLAGTNPPQPHHPTILPEVKDNKQPVAPTLNEDLRKAPSKDLAAHSSSSNMKNPIPIITNTISEKTNTPVDFKTGKATDTEKGGFFLKIGKFEVSHKSSKKK